MSKLLAIIPARGGSKRLPKKNIKNFQGKPIMCWSISSAVKCGLFSQIMVSTDDSEIADIAVKCGAAVPFLRTTDNSDDFATTADVLSEVISKYSLIGNHFDYICCIYPTAPFILAEHIIKGYQEIIAGNHDVVFPVVEFQQSIWRSFCMNSDGLVKANFPENINSRSQDVPTAYHDAGQWYWINVERFKLSKTIFTKNSKAIVISSLAAQDIDTDNDWIIAELKHKAIFKKNRD